MIRADGTLLEVAFKPTGDDSDAVAADIVQVTDEQYALLRDRKARWERGRGIVLVEPRAVSPEEHTTIRLMLRDHRTQTGAAPVRFKIHDVYTDRQLDAASVLKQLLMDSGLADGDEFEVCVTGTGKRPHGDRWFLFGKNRPETDEEVLKRIEETHPMEVSNVD